MIYLILLPIQTIFAFSELHTNHPQSTLYKNYIIFKKNNHIAYSQIQKEGNNHIIISYNKTDFFLHYDYLVAWNQNHIIIYTLQENLDQLTIRITETILKHNDNFTNITISFQYFIAQYQNKQLYVYNLLNKKEKVLNSINKTYVSNIQYQYDDNIAFIYLATDNKFHVFDTNQRFQLDEMILYTFYNGLFSVQYLNNGTVIFQEVNSYLPILYQFNVSRYHQDQKVRIKHLFYISNDYVFAIFTNKEICYHKYQKEKYIVLNDILCMKLEDEYFQIEDVSFNQQIQILLKHNQTNQLAIDYYSKCLLNLINETKQQCSLCLDNNCQDECQTIDIYKFACYKKYVCTIEEISSSEFNANYLFFLFFIFCCCGCCGCCCFRQNFR